MVMDSNNHSPHNHHPAGNGNTAAHNTPIPQPGAEQRRLRVRRLGFPDRSRGRAAPPPGMGTLVTLAITTAYGYSATSTLGRVPGMPRAIYFGRCWMPAAGVPDRGLGVEDTPEVRDWVWTDSMAELAVESH
jgi:hypothetical protein